MLTSKQRAFLRGLGQKLEPVFQVGKSGVTPELIKAVDEALEARELIKLNHLNNCEEEIRDVCERICSRTHADPVQVIGHRFVIYRAAKEPVIEVPGMKLPEKPAKPAEAAKPAVKKPAVKKPAASKNAFKKPADKKAPAKKAAK